MPLSVILKFDVNSNGMSRQAVAVASQLSRVMMLGPVYDGTHVSQVTLMP